MTDFSFHAQRRARFAALLGPNAVAVIPTAPERPRNRDSDFPYRHDSYFFYLTGFAEPGATLVLRTDAQSRPHATLFCQPKDLEREIWDGYRLGPEAAPAALGVEAALSSAQIDAELPGLLDGADSVAYPFATHAGFESRVAGWLDSLRARVRQGALVPTRQLDACCTHWPRHHFGGLHRQPWPCTAGAGAAARTGAALRRFGHARGAHAECA